MRRRSTSACCLRALQVGAAGLILLGTAAILSGCRITKTQVDRVHAGEPVPSDSRHGTLLVHTRDGRVRTFREWGYDSLQRTLTERVTFLESAGVFPGGSTRYVARDSLVHVPVDSIVLLEHRFQATSPLSVPVTMAATAASLAAWEAAARGSLTAITIITGLAVALTPYCIANPKSCFGSCPTFYIPGPAGEDLVAEGFSSSVAPVLEGADIDAIRGPVVGETQFQIQMRNEALETQVVRHVNLLAVPRILGARVFHTGRGEFMEASQVFEPIKAAGPEGSCIAAVRAMDGLERWSMADSIDLAERETLEIEFPPTGPGTFGIAIGSRQTLMTTYLFYQLLAYMGSDAGRYLAMLERNPGPVRRLVSGIGLALGGIQVLVQDRDGTWKAVGEDHETGPIAKDVRLVPLPGSGPAPTRIRLRLTRGAWRLDWIALARLEGEAQPVRFEPRDVRTSDGRPDADARQRLTTGLAALTTLPGDEYNITFEVPEDSGSYEWFLESRGYYLEWIRGEWLREENPERAAMMLTRPAEALRILAPEYKRLEAHMEHDFWRSRFTGWVKAPG